MMHGHLFEIYCDYAKYYLKGIFEQLRIWSIMKRIISVQIIKNKRDKIEGVLYCIKNSTIDKRNYVLTHKVITSVATRGNAEKFRRQKKIPSIPF